MKRILLIDGDIVAFKFAAANEQSIEWEEGVTSSSADLEVAKANVDEHIAGLLQTLDASGYVIALSDSENFRKDIDPTYKSHRVNLKQPVLRRDLEAHLLSQHGAKRKPRLEGDDVLGIIATNPKLYPGAEKIIVSDDKDMQTIPGSVYRREGKECVLKTVSSGQADHYHLLQTLTGDRVDGYPGCPGIGPIKAERILESKFKVGSKVVQHTVAVLWPRVVETYESRGLTSEDALRQARLARILRHEDYDYKRKEPILWRPN